MALRIEIYLFTIICFFFSCSDEPEILVQDITIINDRDFQICLDKALDKNLNSLSYEITFETKSGKKINKAGTFTLGVNNKPQSCFKEQKMQYSIQAYDEDQIKFYNDSIVEGNLNKIYYTIYKHGKSPISKGEIEK